jgi:hypothetical protein
MSIIFDRRLASSPSACATQAADVGVSAVGGLLADVAGVEHDQVGGAGIGSRSHPLRAEQFGHALAVIDVHLAAEAFDVIGFGQVGHCRRL